MRHVATLLTSLVLFLAFLNLNGASGLILFPSVTKKPNI